MAKVDCSELSRMITDLAMNIASDIDVQNLDDVVVEMQKMDKRITREMVSDSIVEATTQEKKTVSEVARIRNEIKREARSDKKLRVAINEYDKAIRNQEKMRKKNIVRKEPTDAIQALQEAKKEIKKKYEKSDPVYGSKLQEQISTLIQKLESKKWELPKPKEQVQLSRQMEKMQLQRDILRRNLRIKIESMKPKTLSEQIWGYVAEPFNFMRSFFSSYDLSGFLRQGGIAVLSHPFKLGSKSLTKMIQAAATEAGAYRIEKQIENRDNYVWYRRGGLELTSWESTARLSNFEEAFMSRLASKLPGSKQSERAYVTGLNYIRANLFDIIAASATRSGKVLTDAEARGIAYYVNAATGRGNMGKLRNAGPVLSTIFFSPRWFLSRIQYLSGMPLIKAGSWRVRKEIAKEYARYAISIGVMIYLASLMGWELEDDPRSTDFGKAKKGKVRVDLTSGLSQLITLATRLGTGEIKSSVSGKIIPIRGEDVKYGGMTTTDLLTQTARYKFSPGIGVVLDALSGKDAINRPTNIWKSIGQHSIPGYWQDAKDVLTSDLGVSDKTAILLLGLLGDSINVYEDRANDKKPKRPSW